MPIERERVNRDLILRVQEMIIEGSLSESRLCEAYVEDEISYREVDILLDWGRSMGYFEVRDMPFDVNDYSQTSRDCIRRYDYRPDFVIYGGEGNTFGVEIEIDGGGESDRKFKEIKGDFEEIYAKHDGSLDRGFELVSHPLTFNYLMSMDWKSMFDRALELGYRSDKTSTCGLHVHVGRSAFKNDEHLASVIAFIYNRWDDVVHFTRRRGSSLDRWASKPNFSDEINDLIYRNRDDRYKAINLTNSATVEFRMFKGTLNSNTFKATVQLLNNLIEITKDKSIKEVMNLTFADVVNYKEYAELNKYMEERAERRRVRQETRLNPFMPYGEPMYVHVGLDEVSDVSSDDYTTTAVAHDNYWSAYAQRAFNDAVTWEFSDDD